MHLIIWLQICVPWPVVTAIAVTKAVAADEKAVEGIVGPILPQEDIGDVAMPTLGRAKKKNMTPKQGKKNRNVCAPKTRSSRKWRLR